MLSVREALQALTVNRLQVLLATFGVAVGVAAMVFLVALVSGAHRFVLEQTRLEGLGLIQVNLQPPRRTMFPARPPFRLNAADADVVGLVSSVGRTSPRRTLSGYTLRQGQEQATAPVLAVNESYLDINRLKVASGRGLVPGDLAASRRVIVLGAGSARAIFDNGDPLGQTVLLNEWPFDVVGVLAWQVEPTEPDRYSYQDTQVFIPYTTAHETFVQPEQADGLSVEIADARQHAEIARAVRAHLIQSKRLTGSQQEWLRVYDSVERTAEMNKIMLVAEGAGRCCRLDLAFRGRRRGDEHHDRERHPADERDWRAPGGRRARIAHPPSVPAGIARRDRRRRPCRSTRGDDAHVGRAARAALGLPETLRLVHDRARRHGGNPADRHCCRRRTRHSRVTDLAGRSPASRVARGTSHGSHEES